MRVKRRKGFLRLCAPSGVFWPLLLLLLVQSCDGFEEIRCKTIDIRNKPQMWTSGSGGASEVKDSSGKATLNKNCTILEGSFLMSMVSDSYHNLTNEAFPRFENVREITGSVLFFQVSGLTSLGWIFPNLRVIGGQSLIQHYSLIVYQNADLQELGLHNLRLIRNGGVRIAENPKLCNAKSIEWNRLQNGPINDVLVDDASEITISEGKIEPCQSCSGDPTPDRCAKSSSSTSGYACWSTDTCQLSCPHDTVGANGSRAGCDDDSWTKCHEECAGGCSAPDDPYSCYACAHISHEGRCIPKCPSDLYSFMNRRCIEKSACEKMHPRAHNSQKQVWKAFAGRCHYQCPENHEEDPANKQACRLCGDECIRTCPGNTTIDSLSKARSLLEHCNVVDGYLEIEMRIGMDSVPAAELTKAFSKIKVINGYLLIRLSPAFINLHMFKSLHTITGSILYRDKYSVAVYENPNLQKLFPPNSNFKVSNGYLQFQNNRMLCFSHIEALMTSLNRFKEMSEIDQSRNSNGDKAICSESSFKVNATEVSATSFTLQWQPYNTTDIDYRKFLGYEIMYKEVALIDKNLSIDDDRSACSDSWNSHFKEVKTSVSDTGHVLTNVKSVDKDGEEEGKSLIPLVDVTIANELIRPNTIYAFYVTTSMVRHEGAHNAVSDIGFITTYFGNPEPPKLTKAEARGPDTIYLEWDPPLHPNGRITYYTITFRPNAPAIDKKRSGCDLQGRLADGLEEVAPSPTPAQSIFVSTVAPDTCSAKGCCACPVDSQTTSLERQELSDFENAIQDIVFIQQKDVPKTQYRYKRSLPEPSEEKTPQDRVDVVETLLKDVNRNEKEDLLLTQMINVTSTNITLTGLKHYTSYFVSVSACQDITAPKHYCSQRKAWKNIITNAIPANDLVDNSTINVEFLNGTSTVRITWMKPEAPNGAVLAYKVKVTNQAIQSTNELCADNVEGWTPHEDGILNNGLIDGDYRVEVRTLSLLGLSQYSTRYEIFTISTPGWWTVQKILIALFALIVFLLLAFGIGYYFVKRYYGGKIVEYATQLISANPEYLSQNDVYKADEWELQRSSLAMEEEIGKGTFGKVFRGYGKDVTSVCGETFGVCAIKTVAESANSAERIHFLLEASVMKKFNSSFIVKLYGVVSDGQPVLVVMEMMEKGNLRDYLRSRRPDAEENIHNLPKPTEMEMYRWAAQIADGMAYLESQRFCHRDLAARNCMVHADCTVKIGDFGMTRDLCYREYYKPAGRRMMPVRWMAPESLVDGRHDMKSDVWSYGVVLYEMWTMGQQPYQGLANDQILEHIARKQHILECPEGCPEEWYTLMSECWKYQPRDRPNFFQIVHHIMNTGGDLGNFPQLSFVAQNPDLLDQAEDEEPAYVAEPHGAVIPMDMANDEDNYMVNSKNKRGANGPALWGEGDALASGDHNGIAEHEV